MEMKRNNILGNRIIEPVVIPYRTPRWSRNIEKIGRALGLLPVFSTYKTITSASPVWNLHESVGVIITLTKNTTLTITNTEENGSGRLLFNPKGYTLTLPSNSKMKAEFNGRVLFSEFNMPINDQFFLLEFIYINKIFHWSLSVYENL
jgi:hypothetical protein